MKRVVLDFHERQEEEDYQGQWRSMPHLKISSLKCKACETATSTIHSCRLKFFDK